MSLASLSLSLALRPCLKVTGERPEQGRYFFGASIDSNPLEIYIVLLRCPDLAFSVSSKLRSPLERKNRVLRGSIA